MNHRRYRRGTAYLIELLGTFAVSSTLLVVVATSLTAMFHAGRTAPRALAEQLAAERLADQFRRDVHAARDVETGGRESGEAAALMMTCLLPDGTRVTFRHAGERLIREQASDAGPPAVEAYRLGAGSDVTIDAPPAAEPDAPRLVRLRIVRPMFAGPLTDRAPTTDAGRRTLLIEATQGRDLLWNATAEEGAR